MFELAQCNKQQILLLCMAGHGKGVASSPCRHLFKLGLSLCLMLFLAEQVRCPHCASMVYQHLRCISLSR